MKICPLCNQTREPGVKCSCGALMQDSGPSSNYHGPYSPYFNMDFKSSSCRHLLTCPECGRDTVVDIALEEH